MSSAVFHNEMMYKYNFPLLKHKLTKIIVNIYSHLFLGVHKIYPVRTVCTVYTVLKLILFKEAFQNIFGYIIRAQNNRILIKKVLIDMP